MPRLSYYHFLSLNKFVMFTSFWDLSDFLSLLSLLGLAKYLSW